MLVSLSPPIRQVNLQLVAKDGEAVSDAPPRGRTLTGESPLLVLPGLACEVGLPEAVFIQQMHYLASVGFGEDRDGYHWVFNSYDEWHQTFPFWSVDAIGRMVRRLVEKGLIEVTAKYNGSSLDQRRWYRIRYEHPCLSEMKPGCTDQSANSQNADANSQNADANSQNADANSQNVNRNKDFRQRLQAENEEPPLPPEGKKRAVRLPVDFIIDGELRAWTIEAGLPATSIDFLLGTMRDWATSKGITRLDWIATWRNFVRREVRDQANRRPANGRHRKPDEVDPDTLPYGSEERAKAIFRRSGF